MRISNRNKIRRGLNRGQTLVEAIIAFGVAAIILVALVAATTMALSRIQFANHQSQARSFAQEGLEWVRGERDKGWDDFVGQASSGGQTYCLNTNPLTDWPSSGNCDATDFSLGGLFKREAVLTIMDPPPAIPPNQKVQAQITVSWQESGQTHKSEQATYLTKWKQ